MKLIEKLKSSSRQTLGALVLAGVGMFSSGCTPGLNRVYLTLDSHPSSAKVYELGKYCGNTPLELPYILSQEVISQGYFDSQPLTFAKEGYMVKKESFRISTSEMKAGSWGIAYQRHALVELERDPSAPLVQHIQQIPQQTGQKTSLEEANEGLDLLLKVKKFNIMGGFGK